MAKNRKFRRINPIAKAPILRKGGAHVKSESAKRQQDKQKLKREMRQGKGRFAPSDVLGVCFYPLIQFA